MPIFIGLITGLEARERTRIVNVVATTVGTSLLGSLFFGVKGLIDSLS